MTRIARHLETLGEPELWLQISVRILAVLGASLLGLTQRDPTLPILSGLGCVTSYYLTDRWGWFRLNRFVGYAAMTGVAVVSLADFFRSVPMQQLLAIASLLVYVQMVLLFQKKQPRIYEQIAIFCALQVVVAALLTTDLFFGALLVLYLVVALSALAAFALYREHLIISVQRTSVSRSRTRLQTFSPADNAPAWRKTLGTRPVAYFPLPTGRWRGAIDASYPGQIGWLAIAALVFAVVFFFRAPRHLSPDHSPSGIGAAQVGFNQQPALDEMGQVLQSNRLVMRASFSDYQTNQPIKLHGDPYLHGVALGTYEFRGRRGAWLNMPRGVPRGDMLPRAPQSDHLVRQRIAPEPTRGETLFSIAPALRTRQTPRHVRTNHQSGQLFWFGDSPTPGSGGGSYTLATTGIRFGVQSTVVLLDDGSDAPATELNKLERMRLLDFEHDRLPKLAELAEQILNEREIDRSNRLLVARALRNHFHVPDLYTYTLNLNMRRDRNVDPLEAFVGDHRRGHCQYFASALTLMLRSQGIPARLVVGYKPDEYNTVGNYYIVREKHAHAWVEAYLEPDDVPDSLLRAGEPRRGAWLRLDPTPGTSEMGFSADASDSLMGQMGNVVDYAQLLWQDYVLGRAAAQQNFVEFQREAEDKYYDDDLLEVPLSLGGRIFAWLSDLFRSPATFMGNLRLAGFLVMVTALVALFVQTRQGLLARLVRLLTGSGEPADSGHRRVEFYERFEALCARVGLRRPATETQQEFARRAGSSLRDDPDSWQPLVEQLSGLFYRVRFGGRELDREETEFVQQTLDRLDAATRV